MLAMRGSSLGRSTTTLSEMPALRCFSTAEGKIAELTAAYAQEFGVTPRFRADAHAGAVVISERGDAKRQIAYVSGTMNVAAARLCEHCKAAEKPLLISAELLRCAAVPFEFAVSGRASIVLRGRQSSAEIHAVRPNAPAASQIDSSVTGKRSQSVLGMCVYYDRDTLPEQHACRHSASFSESNGMALRARLFSGPKQLNMPMLHSIIRSRPSSGRPTALETMVTGR
jgi:hypothetical protein